MRPNTPEDFWRFVEKIPGVDCWIWSGKGSGERYGDFNLRGKVIKAHRFSWELANGPVPNGLSVLHRCDVGFCVRPDHLFIGSQLDNANDRESKGRGNQPRGSRNAHAKLTDSTALEIVRRYNEGEHQNDLAKEFNVDQSTISKVVCGTNWAHIKEKS